jgi:hypothetical protein
MSTTGGWMYTCGGTIPLLFLGQNCEHIVSLHEASCPSTNDELLERSVLLYACTASVILTDVNVSCTLDVILHK